MPRLDDVYDAKEEQAALAAILFPRYARTLAAVHALVASLFPELQDFRLDDAATRAMLAAAAERVVLIDGATRRAIRETLQEGQRRGYSTFELAYGVPRDDFRGIDGLFRETWRGRAEVIAHTEIAHAQNIASLDRFAATGLVSRVKLVEHDDTDAPCAARNGQVVPLSEKPGLLHPNCRLGLVPVVDDAA